jgi:hypothetical protein
MKIATAKVNPARHGFLAVVAPVAAAARGHFSHAAKLLAEEKVIHAGGKEDADDRLPAEVREHVPGAPAPLARHHEDRRRGKVRERPADGEFTKSRAIVAY